MHDLLLKTVIRTCRYRQREGDCSTTKGFSNEILEDAIVQLANRLDIALDTDDPIAGLDLV